jgi:hypothetical protein
VPEPEVPPDVPLRGVVLVPVEPEVPDVPEPLVPELLPLVPEEVPVRLEPLPLWPLGSRDVPDDVPDEVPEVRPDAPLAPWVS